MAKQKNNGGTATAEAPKPSRNRAEGLKIVTTLSVPPSKLRLTEKFRGRAKPVSETEVVERADSIRTEGQLQPVQVRNIPGTDEYEVIFGNTRVRAGNMLAAGYVGGDGKTYEPKPDFLIRCEVVDVDDATALQRNLVENQQRSQTTLVDDALNHENLRQTLKMSDAAITRLYGYAHQASVTRLKKLLTLSEEFQNLVAEGTLTGAGAFVLADCKAEERDAIWLKARDAVGKKGEDAPDGSESGTVGSSAIQAAIRKLREEQREANAAAATTPVDPSAPVGTVPPETGGTVPTGGTAPAPAPVADGGASAAPVKVKALTAKEFKDGITALASDPNCPDKTGDVLKKVLAFAAGECEIKELAKFLKEVVGGEVKPVTPETPAATGTEAPTETPVVA